MSASESWARLLRHAGHWRVMGFGLFAVEERATGALVGEVGLADFRRGLGPDYDGVPEAAWTIAPGAWGRGYAAEAALAAHRWLERQRGGGPTMCMIHRDNARSVSVAQRLGYEPFAELMFRGYPAVAYRRWPSNVVPIRAGVVVEGRGCVHPHPTSPIEGEGL